MKTKQDLIKEFYITRPNRRERVFNDIRGYIQAIPGEKPHDTFIRARESAADFYLHYAQEIKDMSMDEYLALKS